MRTTPDTYRTSPVLRPLLTTFAVQTQVDFHSMNFGKGLPSAILVQKNGSSEETQFCPADSEHAARQ